MPLLSTVSFSIRLSLFKTADAKMPYHSNKKHFAKWMTGRRRGFGLQSSNQKHLQIESKDIYCGNAPLSLKICRVNIYA